jgi:hypothetical protein
MDLPEFLYLYLSKIQIMKKFTSSLIIILFLMGDLFAQVVPVCLTPQKSGVGNTPFETTLADFNNDGKLDIAVSIFSGNQMAVMLGNGSGTFTTAAGSPYTAGTQPWGICNGDFNGDGNQDIVMANYGSSTTNVWLGNGTGAFTPTTSVNGTYADVISGDFNNDGKLDIVAVSAGSNNFNMFIGSGTGTFSLAVGSPYVCGNIALYGEKGDFNNDGNLDVAVINFGGNTISIYLGNGAGGFTQASGSPFATLAQPRDLVIRDFNVDGNQDIAIATQQTSKMQVFLGSGVGTFTQAAGSPYSTLTNGYAITSADYNGDGFLDLVVGNDQTTGTNIYMFLGAGTGSFVASPGSPYSLNGGYYWDFQTADVNGDSKPDIIGTDRGPIFEVTVLLNGIPPAAAVSMTACAGNPLVLNPGPADTYSWSTGASTQSITVSPTTNTMYTVAQVYTLTSCANTSTFNVTANPSPTVAITSPTNMVCAGSPVNLFAGGANTYTWSTAATGASVSVSPSVTTVYSVTGTNTLTGCTNTSTTGIIANALPSLTVVSTNSVICVGQTATLTAMGASSYTWTAGPSSSMYIITPSVTTTFTVAGTNSAGCTNSTSILQNVSACTGITSLTHSNSPLVIYPNPSNGDFKIKGESDLNLIIVNELGETIKKINLSGNNNFEVEISDLSSGIYFVTGQNNSQIIKQKVVIAK